MERNAYDSTSITREPAQIAAALDVRSIMPILQDGLSRIILAHVSNEGPWSPFRTIR